jgi:hypothetical protein
MIRTLSLLLALLFLVALPSAAHAQAACPKEVIVDGRLLERVKVKEEVKLPRLGGERAAAIPTCKDSDPTERTTVKTFRDVPATVAVMLEEDVYVAVGSLVQMSGHPLHDAVYQTSGEPTYRRNECVPQPAPITGTIETDGSLAINQGEGTERLIVDAQTRYADRPPTQPLLEGQKVSVRASKCGPRHVADSITLVGGPVEPRTFAPKAPVENGAPGWVIPAVIAVVALLAAFIARRRRSTLTT